MTTPMIWPARRVGDRILCGWTVNGRQTCGETLATVSYDTLGLPPVRFQPFYEPTPRPRPGEPITLRIGTYAAAKHRQGRNPTRRRPASTPLLHGRHALSAPELNPGEEVAAGGFDRFGLPVVAPCLHGHFSRVDRHTLQSLDT
jgi:hypothetical protein